MPWVPEEEFKFETNYLAKGFRSALRERNEQSAAFLKGTTSEQRLNAIRKKLDFG